MPDFNERLDHKALFSYTRYTVQNHPVKSHFSCSSPISVVNMSMLPVLVAMRDHKTLRNSTKVGELTGGKNANGKLYINIQSAHSIKPFFLNIFHRLCQTFTQSMFMGLVDLRLHLAFTSAQPMETGNV